MPARFLLLTDADVQAVLTADVLIDVMADALRRFSNGRITQPVRTVIPIGDRPDGVLASMPAFAPDLPALGAKLVTVFPRNADVNLPTHQATMVLLNPVTGSLVALIDGRSITEMRTAAVSALSSRLLARTGASSLAIIGSGVQARSHLAALRAIHQLRQVLVWSPNREHREHFVSAERDRLVSTAAASRTAATGTTTDLKAVDHAGEAVVGADLIVLATASTTPVIESGWVKPGAHVMSVGACRPTERELDPDLIRRSRLFVDSRAAALVESGDVVLGIAEGCFGQDQIVAELGEVLNGVRGRRTDSEVTVFKSLGLAVEDVAAADLAYRKAIAAGLGRELEL